MEKNINHKLKKKYVLYSDNFPPEEGGIPEYALGLSSVLNRRGQLDSVLSGAKALPNTDFNVFLTSFRHQRNLGQRFLDSVIVFRKWNTFIHKQILKKQIRSDLKPYLNQKNNLKFVILSYYTYWQESFVEEVRKAGFNYMIVLHGLDIKMRMNEAPKAFNKNICRASKLIFNSEATKLLAHENRLNVRNSVVIHPGINENLIALAESGINNAFDFSNKKPQFPICTITRLVQRKGTDLTLQALHGLVHNNGLHDIIFYIAGRGPETENLEQLVIKLNLKNNVVFLGYISEEEKVALLNNSKIFVMPSHDRDNVDWEGFGISYMEASFFGLPVIGGSTGGIKEAIVENKTGFCIHSKNSDDAVKEIEDRILFLYQDHDQLNNIGTNGKTFARQFTWDKLVPLEL